jgi:hypothetical protein
MSKKRTKTTRGGSYRGKFKPGKTKQAQTHKNRHRSPTLRKNP